MPAHLLPVLISLNIPISPDFFPSSAPFQLVLHDARLLPFSRSPKYSHFLPYPCHPFPPSPVTQKFHYRKKFHTQKLFTSKISKPTDKKAPKRRPVSYVCVGRKKKRRRNQKKRKKFHVLLLCYQFQCTSCVK